MNVAELKAYLNGCPDEATVLIDDAEFGPLTARLVMLGAAEPIRDGKQGDDDGGRWNHVRPTRSHLANVVLISSE